jgi:F0F1-type ATP synthase gamma subunit
VALDNTKSKDLSFRSQYKDLRESKDLTEFGQVFSVTIKEYISEELYEEDIFYTGNVWLPVFAGGDHY